MFHTYLKDSVLIIIKNSTIVTMSRPQAIKKYIMVALFMSLLNKKSESMFKESPITPTQPSPTKEVFMYLWGNLGYILKEATMFTVLAPIIY